MTDADVPFERGKVILSECLGDQSHPGVQLDTVAIANGDAGAFLTAMLQCEKSEKSRLCHIYARGIDPKNAAAFVHTSCLYRAIVEHLAVRVNFTRIPYRGMIYGIIKRGSLL